MSAANGDTPAGNSEALAPLGSGAMFDGIAPRYDRLNRILSLGIDQRWRRRAVSALGLDAQPRRVLDLATGTADVAIAIATTHPTAQVTGVDPSAGMLAIGQRKLVTRKLTERITLQVGDGQALPFADASFDAAIIAFGIRNVPDRDRALAEMRRVVRPGGRVVVLELTDPAGRGLARVARFHVHQLVPRIGGWLSGSREYRHLQRSIANFPPGATFAQQLTQAGLGEVDARPLVLGVAHIFTGTVPAAGAA